VTSLYQATGNGSQLLSRRHHVGIEALIEKQNFQDLDVGHRKAQEAVLDAIEALFLDSRNQAAIFNQRR
jgi:hypothetical protein